MKHYTIHLCVFCFLCMLCVACDHVDESEQLIYVKPAAIGRNVLIEDFTGQACINCPTATEKIHELQESYGADKVVAVAIYSGDFGYIRGNRERPYSLTTALGDEYFTHWSLSDQPVGMVNRQAPSDYAKWGTQVYQQMQAEAKVRLVVSALYSPDSRTIKVSVLSTAQDDALEGKLQLWLTEDSITDRQCMPDGNWNSEYRHNHVFRDTVNGKWGSDFKIEKGENKTESFTYTLAADCAWKPENLRVVAFVYTDNGVEQVEQEGLVVED